MINYIHLQNYKSFTDATIDFRTKNKQPKPVIIIYGENGAGKTNLINVLETLTKTFRSMQLKHFLMDYLENSKEQIDESDLQNLNSITDISKIIKDCKTVSSDENMIIEIGFQIDGKNGVYYLETNNELIVKEKLDFTLAKNKGNYFDFSVNEKKMNSYIFSNSFSKQIQHLVDRFWGKHSLISLLYYEQDESVNEYFSNNVNTNLLTVMDYFLNISTYLVGSHRIWGNVKSTNLLLTSFENGTIDIEDEHIISNSEKIVRHYLTSLYRDIKNVRYETSKTDDHINYRLKVTKLIGGQERELDFSSESTGTQNLLLLLPYFLIATQPGVVAIDEIDNGIHDVLLRNLLELLLADNNGQLIVTTHNLLLLENKKLRDSFYFINIDENGFKSVKSISEYEHRIQPEHNVLSRYIDGWFHGLPWENIDFSFKELDELLNTCKNNIRMER